MTTFLSENFEWLVGKVKTAADTAYEDARSFSERKARELSETAEEATQAATEKAYEAWVYTQDALYDAMIKVGVKAYKAKKLAQNKAYEVVSSCFGKDNADWASEKSLEMEAMAIEAADRAYNAMEQAYQDNMPSREEVRQYAIRMYNKTVGEANLSMQSLQSLMERMDLDEQVRGYNQHVVKPLYGEDSATWFLNELQGLFTSGLGMFGSAEEVEEVEESSVTPTQQSRREEVFSVVKANIQREALYQVVGPMLRRLLESVSPTMGGAIAQGLMAYIYDAKKSKTRAEVKALTTSVTRDVALNRFNGTYNDFMQMFLFNHQILYRDGRVTKALNQLIVRQKQGKAIERDIGPKADFLLNLPNLAGSALTVWAYGGMPALLTSVASGALIAGYYSRTVDAIVQKSTNETNKKAEFNQVAYSALDNILNAVLQGDIEATREILEGGFQELIDAGIEIGAAEEELNQPITSTRSGGLRRFA